MNRIGCMSKYSYKNGTYTTIKFMLHQSKSACGLQIDLIVDNDVHLICREKVLILIVNHEVINIMSPIGSLVIC
jgi:hypothetical protein